MQSPRFSVPAIVRMFDLFLTLGSEIQRHQDEYNGQQPGVALDAS